MPSPPVTAARSPADRQRQERGDPRAHRIAHNVGARQRQMIEERAHVLRHDRAVIGGRLIELGRLAVPAIVERDDAASTARVSVVTQPGRPSSPPCWKQSRG